MKRIGITVKNVLFVVVCLLLSAGASLAAEGIQKNKSSMKQTEQLRADTQTAYQRSSDLTAKGDETLFLPGGKVGDANSAQEMYKGSNVIIGDFLGKWKEYAEIPALFAMMDVLRVHNARGLAWAVLVKGDKAKSDQYRQETVDLADKALDGIAKSTIENPQFPEAKLRLQRDLAEGHLFLSLHYLATDAAKAKKHLNLARETAPDPETKAMIDSYFKSK